MQTQPPAFVPISKSERADVCVIGAGIAGLTTAYLLAKSGKSVIVFDDGAIGGGETCRTTAQLTIALDHRYFKLEHLHGLDGARWIFAKFALQAWNLLTIICMSDVTLTYI